MAKTAYKSVDQYIAAQPEHGRDALQRVRATIRKALPKAEEVVSYQIPAYKLNGSMVIYFAGWKAHYSIYPATGRVLEAFARELEPYEIRKSTVRFPLTARIPVGLIARIAKFRAAEAAERGK